MNFKLTFQNKNIGNRKVGKSKKADFYGVFRNIFAESALISQASQSKVSCLLLIGEFKNKVRIPRGNNAYRRLEQTAKVGGFYII